jgi:hypothetical protein
MPNFETTSNTSAVSANAAKAVDEFKTSLRGELIRPGNNNYDETRKVWNAMINKRPALIVRCAGVDDIVQSVRFARDNKLEVSVRGGGHSIAGSCLCDGGLMIDFTAMKGIRVDPIRRTVRAQPGLKLGEFDRETQAFGLATTMGIATDTGIAGLTLGGGYGWLAGKYGLACDNLLSVELVTAEGQLVTASENENPDLFWGVRGGGGNFGIVASFEYMLYSLGKVLGGMALYSPNKEALRFFDEFSSTCPDEVSTVGLLLTAPDGTQAFAIAVCYCGSLEKGEKVLEPLRTFGPPIVDMIQPRSYLEMQSFTDDTWPPGRFYYWKSSLIRRLCDEAIETLLEHARRMPNHFSLIYLQQLHGAASRIAAGDTAFPHRFDHYNCGAMLITEDAAETGAGIKWARDCWEAMQPYVERSNYVNDLGDEGEVRIREGYGPNYDRLLFLKNKYDPTNFFRLNQNIRPIAT